jgi:hypothetical protein
MMAMYQVHNKQKVEFIPQLIHEWCGKERELIEAVRQKYCHYAGQNNNGICIDCGAHSTNGYGKLNKINNETDVSIGTNK